MVIISCLLAVHEDILSIFVFESSYGFSFHVEICDFCIRYEVRVKSILSHYVALVPFGSHMSL